MFWGGVHQFDSHPLSSVSRLWSNCRQASFTKQFTIHVRHIHILYYTRPQEYLDERIHRHGDTRKARVTEGFPDAYPDTGFHTDEAPDTLGSSRFGQLDMMNLFMEKFLSSIQDRDDNLRLEDTDFTNPFQVQFSLRDGKMPRKPLFRSTTSYELSVQRLYEKIIARTEPTNIFSDHLHRPEFPTQRNKCLYSSASATSNQAPTTSRMQPPDSWIALSYPSPSQQVSPITGMRRC